MSGPSTDGISLLDPFGFWKAARDANLETWSKLMIDIVNSDEYAQATGAALEQYLALSQPAREALGKSMTQTLAMLNMPTRAEVISVAERLVNVEMRLDDLDAKLTNVQGALQETIKDTVHQALATPGRHLKNIETRLDEMGARFDATQTSNRQLQNIETRLNDLDATLTALQDLMKDVVRQALQTPERRIREVEARIEEVGTKLNALQVPVGAPVQPEIKSEAQARKPEPGPKPAQPTTKKEQEGK